jgi:hypothetical protein
MAKKKKASGKPKGKGKAKSTRKPKPRQQALAGMERVRSVELDEICESVGDGRDKKNKIAADEKDELRRAMKIMVAKNIHAYSHAGVRLVRVPGEEKLLVKKGKDEATEVEQPEAPKQTSAERAGRSQEPAGGGENAETTGSDNPDDEIIP